MPGIPERRARTLTDADLEALSALLATSAERDHSTDLTVEEEVLLKRLLKKLDNISTNIGRVLVVAIVATLLAWLTEGFWSSLVEKIPK